MEVPSSGEETDEVLMSRNNSQSSAFLTTSAAVQAANAPSSSTTVPPAFGSSSDRSCITGGPSAFVELRKFVRASRRPVLDREDALPASTSASSSAFEKLHSRVRSSLHLSKSSHVDLIPEWKHPISLEFLGLESTADLGDEVSPERLDGTSQSGGTDTLNAKERAAAVPGGARQANGAGSVSTTARESAEVRVTSSEQVGGSAVSSSVVDQTSTAISAYSSAGEPVASLTPLQEAAYQSLRRSSSASPAESIVEAAVSAPLSVGPRRAAPPHLAVASVTPISQLEDELAALQRRYQRVLATMEQEAMGGVSVGPPIWPPLTNAVKDGENPGRELLQFAKTCLEELGTALLTGPFSYLPELDEPADLLQGALRALLSTDDALHHELELRSIAYSRHWLQLTALRQHLTREWNETVDAAIADVGAQRRSVMEKLSEQIETNMATVQQLAAFVDHTERLSDGRSRVQNTYARLLDLTAMKRKEVLMYRAQLLKASQNTDNFKSEIVTMRNSMAKFMRTESVQELMEQQSAQDVDTEVVYMQDALTDMRQEIAEGKRQTRRLTLKKNKAVQQERRLHQRCIHIAVHLRKLKVLTQDAEQSMEDRHRSLGTLTARLSTVHEYVQTSRIQVRRRLTLLDTEVLQQLAVENEVVGMDIGPMIRELRALEAEANAAAQRNIQTQKQLVELRRQRNMKTAQRNRLLNIVQETVTNIDTVKTDLVNIRSEHESMMTRLREQLVLASEMLKISQVKWSELQDVYGLMMNDLRAVQARSDQVQQELAARREETNIIMAKANKQLEQAMLVRTTIAENLAEETDILEHLRAVVEDIGGGQHTALLRVERKLEDLSSQTEKLKQMKILNAELLTVARGAAAERREQVTALQQQFQEMQQRWAEQEHEISQLRELRSRQAKAIEEKQRQARLTRASYSSMGLRFGVEQMEQEQLIEALRSWSREVAVCNGGYRIEVKRMRREMAEFYSNMEVNTIREMAESTRLLDEAILELERLTSLHNQKHADSVERDWRLRAELLASAAAAESSLQPVSRTMAGLDTERRRLIKMVQAAVRMRPFGDVQVDIEQAVCPLLTPGDATVRHNTGHVQ